MSHIIIFIDHECNINTIQVVRLPDSNYSMPLLFKSNDEAIEWADEFLGGMPYQVIAADDFKSSNERP